MAFHVLCHLSSLAGGTLFRPARPAENWHLTQKDALRALNLLNLKDVKSGNYLDQGDPSQKAALNKLAADTGCQWLDRKAINALGGSLAGTNNGRCLYGIIVRTRLWHRTRSALEPTRHPLAALSPPPPPLVPLAQAVREKYSHTRFLCVSTLQPPDTLPPGAERQA